MTHTDLFRKQTLKSKHEPFVAARAGSGWLKNTVCFSPIAPAKSCAAMLSLFLFVVPAGCQQVVTPNETTRIDADHGAQVFSQECAVCHGEDARGGGVASLGLAVVPPDLTLFARNNGGVFPRDRVMSVIDGYYRQEHVFDPMPIFGERDMGPNVLVEEDGVATPVPANLLALANYLESVQQK